MKKDDHMSICPICKQANHCQATSKLPCWCYHETFPQELLNKYPKAACICVDCLKKHQENKKLSPE